MNPLSLLIPLLTHMDQIMSLLPFVQRVIARGFTVNSIAEDLSDLNSTHLLDWLKINGTAFFPDVKPDLQVAAGAVLVAPDYVMKIQQLLNKVMSPSPNLDIDGRLGPKTRAAVIAYQTAKGLTVDAFPGDATRAALEADSVKTTPVALGGSGEKANTVEVQKVADAPTPAPVPKAAAPAK
jgi:lysozyme family protein